MNKDKSKATSIAINSAIESGTFYIGDVKIEPAINAISTRGGLTRKISSRQMSALTKLAMNYGQVVSRADMHQILCLSQEGHRDRAALSHHIGKIRRELGDTGRESKFIQTIRGGGYYLLQEPKLEPPLVWEDSPYRGLKPYRYQHAPIFFGRSKDISEIINSVSMRRNNGSSMVWVSGASGVGKSSLIEAGVLPQLHDRATSDEVHLVHAIFRYRSSQGGLFDDFVDVLVAAFPQIIEIVENTAELAKTLNEEPHLAGAKIAGILDKSTLRAVKSKPADKQAKRIQLVIFIDQIDEMIASENIQEGEIESFFEALVSLSKSDCILVIGAVRLDYLPQCLSNTTLGSELLDGGLHIIQNPTIAEVREMILRPAEILNLSFETNESGLALSDVIIQDAFPNVESLPILGFTLELLFRNCHNNQLTFSQYQKIGGIEGCLARHCDEVFHRLEDNVQECLGGVLSYLTSSKVEPGRSITARAAPWQEIAYSSSAELLIEAFLNARIFTVARDQNGTKVVHLAHEAVLFSWSRAKAWVDANDDSIRIKSKMDLDMSNWQEGAKDRSYLLSAGLRLEEAQSLLSSEIELSKNEREYIKASLGQKNLLQRKQKLLKVRIATSAVIFAMLSVVTSGLGFSYWRELQNTTQLMKAAERASHLAMVEREVAESTSELMVETFSFSTPENKKGLVLSARELLDRKLDKISSNIAINPALKASHLTALGRAYLGLNEHKVGIDLLERSLGILRASESSDQLQLARTLTILAQSLSVRTHNTKRAKPYLIESITILSKHPSSFLQVSKTFEVYAGVLQLENDFAGAENALKQALIELCDRVPDTNRQLKSLRVLLGRNLAIQSKFVQAESISREVLRSDRVELSGSDPQLVAPISQYAYYLYNVGKLQESIDLYREALAIQLSNYAEDHWRVARSKGRLGHLLVQKGEYQEAEKILTEAIESETNTNGPYSIDVGIFKVSLADSLVQSGSAAEAKSQVSDAIRIIQSKEGPTAGLMYMANNVLGASMVKLGQCETGFKLMQDSYQTMQANRGDKSPYTNEMHRRLGKLQERKSCSA